MDLIKEKKIEVKDERIETGLEQKVELHPEKTAEEKALELVPSLGVGATQANDAIAQDKDEDLLIIESILAEDIQELYNQLATFRKKLFKKKGEETALQIKNMMRLARVKMHEVFELIKRWLKMLPGINHYFLEQEAKIKTDKIFALRREGQKIKK